MILQVRQLLASLLLLLRVGATDLLHRQSASSWQLEVRPPLEHPVFAHYEFLVPLHAVELPESKGCTNRFEIEALKGQSNSTRNYLWFLRRLGASDPDNVAGKPSALPQSPLPNTKLVKRLGNGAYGVTYLARDKRDGTLVAIKILTYEGKWLKRGDIRYSPFLQELAKESKDECEKAKGIHDFADEDREGSSHVMQCLEDGVAKALDHASSESTPLYLVLEFKGQKTLDKWWHDKVGLVQSGKLDKAIAANDYKRLMRHLLLGVNFMSSLLRDVQWVHHDLKPENIVVDDTRPDEPELSIIDIGLALSTQAPGEKSASTREFRPPEFMMFPAAVGFAMPAHSFDTYAVALLMMSLAAPPFDGIFFHPPFVYPSMNTAEMKAWTPKNLIRLSDCMESLQAEAGALQPPTDQTGNPIQISRKSQRKLRHAWVDRFVECAGNTRTRELQNTLKEVLDPVQTASGQDRARRMIGLLGCPFNYIRGTYMDNHTINNPLLVDLVNDWVASGFDVVLMQMLSADPEQRPHPSRVLQAAWFQDAPKPQKEVVHEYECPSVQSNFGIFFFPIVFPLIALLGFGCCSCFGLCCCIYYEMRGGQTVGWMVCMISLCTLGAGMSIGIWFDGLLSWFFFLAGLGVCIASYYHGPHRENAKLDQRAKSNWPVMLGCAAAYCVVILMVTSARTAAVRRQVRIATEALDVHIARLVKIEALPRGIEPVQIQNFKSLVGWIRPLIVAPAFPALHGLLISLYGLVRWGAHKPPSRALIDGAHTEHRIGTRTQAIIDAELEMRKV